MAAFIGSRTEANLRWAFATAMLAHRHYITLSRQYEAGGDHQAAEVCGAIATSRANHAAAHLNILEPCDDKTGTIFNVRLAIMGNLDPCSGAWPAMARTAHQEGFHEIAGWFEVRAKAGHSHRRRFHRLLETVL